jgi:hypothetical protein
MAEDFNIKVTTTADTSGIKQVKAELDALKTRTSTGTTAVGTTADTSGVVAENEKAASLARANALRATSAELAGTETAAVTQAAAIESQRQVIAQTRLDLAVAINAGDETQIALLENELRIRTAIIGLMRAQTLSAADLNALTETEATLLGAVRSETQAATGSSILMGASFGKARGEAVVLARELATGGNYIRTMGSLLGALGVPISIAATLAFVIYTHFKKAAEEEKKMTEEMGRLNIEAQKTAISFDRIRTAADLSKETETIRTNIELLRNKQAVETDPKKIAQLQSEIGIQETLLSRLGIRSQRALELAEHEKQVGVTISDQVHDLELADKSFERQRERIKEQADVEKELNQIRLQARNVQIQGAEDRGEITKTQAEVETAQAKMAVGEADYALQKKSLEDQISLIGQQGAKAKENLDNQNKAVKTITDQQTAEAELGREVEVRTQRYNDARNAAAEARKTEEAAAGGVTGFSSKSLADQAAASEKLHSATLAAQQKEQAAADQLTETQKQAAVAQDPEHQKELTDEVRKQQEILKERGKAYENARDAEETLLPKLQEELKTTLQILQAREAAAKAELAAKVAETEFQAFKAGGGTVSGTIAAEQQRSQQEAQQRNIFDHAREMIRQDIAHGAKPDKDLLEAFGTPEEQQKPTAPQPLQVTANIDQDQLQATKEYEKTLTPAPAPVSAPVTTPTIETEPQTIATAAQPLPKITAQPGTIGTTEQPLPEVPATPGTIGTEEAPLPPEAPSAPEGSPESAPSQQKGYTQPILSGTLLDKITTQKAPETASKTGTQEPAWANKLVSVLARLESSLS